MNPVVPQEIEDIIQRFGASIEALDEHEVRQALVVARDELKKTSEEERLGIWAEVLAFALSGGGGERGTSPWGTYFRPIGSMLGNDGTEVYFQNIAGTDAEVVAHWSQRAKTIAHPVMVARYADLVWDMSRPIANVRPDHAMAGKAIDAYLASVTGSLRKSLHGEFEAAERALQLGLMVRDDARVRAAVRVTLTLHDKVVASGDQLWWRAFDHLIDQRGVELQVEETERLVLDLEKLCVKFSSNVPKIFDPHAVENAAKRLIGYYRKRGRRGDVLRLNRLIAEAFERAASLADPMLASSFLRTAVTAYRDAGAPEDVKRTRFAMEEKIAASREQMGTVSFETKISKDDMEKFLSSVVLADVGSTFARIASDFVDSRSGLEDRLKKSAEKSPLTSMITQSVVGDRQVSASVGSLADDPFGRLVQYAARTIVLGRVWLAAALERAVDVHALTPHHFVGWAMRKQLFSDPTLLVEGIEAWFLRDFVKTIHVLVPQIEVAVRAIAEGLGRPTTKPHPKIHGASVSINLGDLLYSDDVTSAIGPDVTLHLLAIYSDPRGLNIRNDLAHGLMSSDQMDEGTANLVIHSILLLGVWEELAKARAR